MNVLINEDGEFYKKVAIDVSPIDFMEYLEQEFGGYFNFLGVVLMRPATKEEIAVHGLEEGHMFETNIVTKNSSAYYKAETNFEREELELLLEKAAKLWETLTKVMETRDLVKEKVKNIDQKVPELSHKIAVSVLDELVQELSEKHKQITKKGVGKVTNGFNYRKED